MQETLYHSRKRPPKGPHYEPIDEELLVETGGYIPPKVQIENLINAGKRLQEWRKENYDFFPKNPDEDPPQEIFDNPTREKGFDEFDAVDILNTEDQRLQTLGGIEDDGSGSEGTTQEAESNEADTTAKPDEEKEEVP